MKMKSKSLFLLFLLPVVAMGAEETVAVKFRAVGPGLAPLVVNCPDANPSRIEIPEGSRSVLHTYRGSPATALQDTVGGRVFPVRFPDSSKLLLAVLLAGESGNLETLVLEDDSEVSPLGSITMVNIGTRAVKTKVGDSDQLLEPKASVVFPGEGKPTAFVQITAPDTGEILLSNNWGISPRSRTLALVEWQEGTPPRLVFHRITENEPPKK